MACYGLVRHYFGIINRQETALPYSYQGTENEEYCSCCVPISTKAQCGQRLLFVLTSAAGKYRYACTMSCRDRCTACSHSIMPCGEDEVFNGFFQTLWFEQIPLLSLSMPFIIISNWYRNVIRMRNWTSLLWVCFLHNYCIQHTLPFLSFSSWYLFYVHKEGNKKDKETICLKMWISQFLLTWR